VLVRLRSDRCFYADPPSAVRSPKGGRPRRHGAKFNCADPSSWPTPTAALTCQDDQYGTVTVAAWTGLHPKQQRHPGHGTRRPRPIVPGTILRVQVERVPARTRPPKVLWLWWPARQAGSPTWTWPGAPTFAASTSSTPSASPSRPLAGPCRGHAIPSRPTVGPGWCWPPTPSSAWLARSPAISACRGRGPDHNYGCHRCGSAAGFREFWPRWARRLLRRNPQGVLPAAPRVAARDPPGATQRSRSQPPSPVRSHPPRRRLPDRTSPAPRRDLGQRPARHATRLNHKLRAGRQPWRLRLNPLDMSAGTVISAVWTGFRP